MAGEMKDGSNLPDTSVAAMTATLFMPGKATPVANDPDFDGDDEGSAGDAPPARKKAAPDAARAKAAEARAAAKAEAEADEAAKTAADEAETDPAPKETAAELAARLLGMEGDPFDAARGGDPELTEAETAAEAEAEIAAETELTEEEIAARDAFTPAQQAQFDKAVQKKHAATKAAKAELARAQGQLAAAQAELAAARSAGPAAAPAADNPMARLDTPAKIDAELASQKAWRNWCRTHPDGGELTIDGKATELSRERTLEIQIQAEDAIAEHLPAQRAHLAQRDAADQAAMTAHPWLKNAQAQGTVKINAILAANPALARLPNIRLILANSLAWQASQTAKGGKAEARGQKAEARKPTPRAPGSPSGSLRPPIVAARGKAKAAASEAFLATGVDKGNALLGSLLFGD